MSAKHTPGLWEIQGGISLVGDPMSRGGQHALYCATVKQENYVGGVCSIQSADHCETGITREAAEANARLIAAAPELLDALKGVLTQHHSPDSKEPEIVRAYAAIAKATGSAA